MRALITGAQGFTGRYVAAHWLKADPRIEVFGLGRSSRDDHAFTHRITKGNESIQAPLTAAIADALGSARYKYFSVDLFDRADVSLLMADVSPRFIIHLASGLRDDPTEYLFKTNVIGTENLYHAVVACGAPPPSIVVGSSGSIYGIVADQHLPITENQAPAPFDMYSISKCAQESVARMLGHHFRIPTVIARIFAIVGPGQEERHICGRIASQIAGIEAGGQPPEVTLGPLTATRDFIDVRDVAEALVHLAVRGGDGTTYNVGSGLETPVQLVYDELVRLAHTAPPKIKQGPARTIDMPRNFAQVSRLTALGVEPRYDLRQSLADLLDYYRCSFHGIPFEPAVADRQRPRH